MLQAWRTAVQNYVFSAHMKGKKEPFLSRADNRVGNGRILVFEKDASSSNPTSTLTPALSTRFIKTNKQKKKLVHCPQDKEHPVSWSHSTSGGLMWPLSNTWPGDTVILCLTCLQRKADIWKRQKASSCDASTSSPVSLESVGACEQHRHELM